MFVQYPKSITLEAKLEQILYLKQLQPSYNTDRPTRFDIGEISRTITTRLDKYSLGNNTGPLISEAYLEDSDFPAVGIVTQVGDGIARVSGLKRTMAGETLEFTTMDPISQTLTRSLGIAFNLEKDDIGAVLLSPSSSLNIVEGTSVRRTYSLLSIPVIPPAIESKRACVVNALGHLIVPSMGEVSTNQYPTRPVEFSAPSIIERKSVCQPLQTGIIAIDSMIPIGCGQRELIIGDRQTGKTSIAIDTIINQVKQRERDRNYPIVTCVYVAIGQKASSVASVVNTLGEANALENTIIVVANADAPAALQYIAPYTGTAIAEHYMYEGNTTLCIYDDLTKHASAYREMSLLLRRPPGREAYPGDVFYLHSRLLERAAKLNEDRSGGSLTALPIIETQAGDVSAYIPTNVISITDGQIFLSADLFNAGVRPAINIGLSVSRVGSSAQIKAMKKVAGTLKLELAQFTELETFSQFASDLDPLTQRQLAKGERLREILKQPQNSPIAVEDQIMIIYAALNGWLDHLDLSDVALFIKWICVFMNTAYSDIGEAIKYTKLLNASTRSYLEVGLQSTKDTFKSIGESLISELITKFGKNWTECQVLQRETLIRSVEKAFDSQSESKNDNKGEVTIPKVDFLEKNLTDESS